MHFSECATALGRSSSVALSGWLGGMLCGAMLVGCGQQPQPVPHARAGTATPIAGGSSSAAKGAATARSSAASGSTATLSSVGPVASVWPIRKIGSAKPRPARDKWIPELEPEAIESCDRFLKVPYAVSDAPSQAEL